MVRTILLLVYPFCYEYGDTAAIAAAIAENESFNIMKIGTEQRRPAKRQEQ
jgi:hypothetical protein